MDTNQPKAVCVSTQLGKLPGRLDGFIITWVAQIVSIVLCFYFLPWWELYLSRVQNQENHDHLFHNVHGWRYAVVTLWTKLFPSLRNERKIIPDPVIFHNAYKYLIKHILFLLLVFLLRMNLRSVWY